MGVYKNGRIEEEHVTPTEVHNLGEILLKIRRTPSHVLIQQWFLFMQLCYCFSLLLRIIRSSFLRLKVRFLCMKYPPTLYRGTAPCTGNDNDSRQVGDNM